MRHIVEKVDYQKRCFYAQIGHKLEGFYLSNRLAKTFLPYINKGTIVDFTVGPNRKKMGSRLMYSVTYFIYIAQTNPYHVIYDFYKLRQDMKNILASFDYFLFLDCEMTMPGYQPGAFSPQVIQVGYVLSRQGGKVIKNDDYYVKPLKPSDITKRAIKFLDLDLDDFGKSAKSYAHFYQDMYKLKQQYNPKIVVWGKNDISAILESFTLHNVEPIFTASDFIDLLKLHKDFFNLRNDVGLFKAYQTYYDHDSSKQTHDAKADSYITKDIFDAFIEVMQKYSQ